MFCYSNRKQNNISPLGWKNSRYFYQGQRWALTWYVELRTPPGAPSYRLQWSRNSWVLRTCCIPPWQQWSYALCFYISLLACHESPETSTSFSHLSTYRPAPWGPRDLQRWISNSFCSNMKDTCWEIPEYDIPLMKLGIREIRKLL